jgi:fused signal recognition particle receptor
VNELQVILKDQGVETNSAKQLLDAFGAPFEEAGKILSNYQEIKVTGPKDTAAMAEAHDKRLALKKVRTTVENKRKELKADIVKSGKVIDSVARFVKEVIAPAEEYLQSQEDFVKIQKQKRLAEIRETRLLELSKLTDNPTVYDIDNMDDEQFSILIERLNKEVADREAAVKLAEEVRLKEEAAEKSRQAEIAAENERLKAEAIKREAEQTRLNNEAQKVAQEKQALEAEIARKEAEERKVAEEIVASEKAKASAPDRDKLIAYAQALQDVPRPELQGEVALDIMSNATQFLVTLTNKISDKARKL